jgi:RHS repeat-associated protein
MRVAVYDGTDLEYFATDHLRSTVLVMDDMGNKLSEQRYLPFGEVRTDVGTAITQTDFGFTGQRNKAYINLIDFRARFYSPALGRFTQPDTIVPNPANSQSWNRFSYAQNNPVNFNDPTGHIPEGECGFASGGCGDPTWEGYHRSRESQKWPGGQPGKIDEDAKAESETPNWGRKIIDSIIPSGVGFEFETSAGSLLPTPTLTQAQSSTELVYLWETPKDIHVVKSRAWLGEGGDTYKFRVGMPSFYVSFSIGINVYFHTAFTDLGGYDKTKGVAAGPNIILSANPYLESSRSYDAAYPTGNYISNEYGGNPQSKGGGLEAGLKFPPWGVIDPELTIAVERSVVTETINIPSFWRSLFAPIYNYDPLPTIQQ